MSAYEQRAREWLDGFCPGESGASDVARLTALCESIAAEARGQALRDVAAAFNGDETWTEIEIRDWLRAAAGDQPSTHQWVAREDLATVIEAAAELEQRIRAERAGYDVSRAEEIRAAIEAIR